MKKKLIPIISGQLNKNMGTLNILEIEKQKNLLLENLSIGSAKQKVFLISHFFGELLSAKGGDVNKIKEAYLAEFINDYLNYLSTFDPFCLHPKYSKLIIE